jgi:hypothetical protein
MKAKATLKKIKGEKFWSITIKPLGIIGLVGKSPKDAIKVAIAALESHYEQYVGDAKNIGTCQIDCKIETLIVDMESGRGVAELKLYPVFFKEFLASRKNA